MMGGDNLGRDGADVVTVIAILGIVGSSVTVGLNARGGGLAAVADVSVVLVRLQIATAFAALGGVGPDLRLFGKRLSWASFQAPLGFPVVTGRMKKRWGFIRVPEIATRTLDFKRKDSGGNGIRAYLRAAGLSADELFIRTVCWVLIAFFGALVLRIILRRRRNLPRFPGPEIALACLALPGLIHASSAAFILGSVGFQIAAGLTILAALFGALGIWRIALVFRQSPPRRLHAWANRISVVLDGPHLSNDEETPPSSEGTTDVAFVVQDLRWADRWTSGGLYGSWTRSRDPDTQWVMTILKGMVFDRVTNAVSSWFLTRIFIDKIAIPGTLVLLSPLDRGLQSGVALGLAVMKLLIVFVDLPYVGMAANLRDLVTSSIDVVAFSMIASGVRRRLILRLHIAGALAVGIMHLLGLAAICLRQTPSEKKVSLFRGTNRSTRLRALFYPDEERLPAGVTEAVLELVEIQKNQQSQAPLVTEKVVAAFEEPFTAFRDAFLRTWRGLRTGILVTDRDHIRVAELAGLEAAISVLGIDRSATVDPHVDADETGYELTLVLIRACRDAIAVKVASLASPSSLALDIARVVALQSFDRAVELLAIDLTVRHGADVELVDLINSSHLNGRRGRVTGQRDDKRWVVDLGDDVVAVKDLNILVLDQDPIHDPLAQHLTLMSLLPGYYDEDLLDDYHHNTFGDGRPLDDDDFKSSDDTSDGGPRVVPIRLSHDPLLARIFSL